MGTLAKKTIDKISRSQKALGDKTGYIGATTFYDVGSEASVTDTDLEKYFDKVGLSKIHLPSLPSARKVFAYVIGRGSVGVADAQVIRISSEPTHDVWGIYPVSVTGEEKPVMQRDVELGEPLAKLGFFPDDPNNPGQPLLVAADQSGGCTVTPSNPVAATILDEWNRRKGLFTSPDISQMIRSSLKHFGRIRLKKSGHAYFVPASRMEDLQKLRDVIEMIGGEGTHMSIIPAANHPEGRATITSEAKKGFESGIKEIREKVAEFTKSTRESTKEKTIQEALALKCQLELYREISEDLVESLSSDTEQLVREVQSMMGAE